MSSYEISSWPSKDDLDKLTKSLMEEAQEHSIMALLHRHCRERLFVDPLLWDYRQPALLQCRFLRSEKSSQNLLSPEPDSTDPEEYPEDWRAERDEAARIFVRAPDWTTKFHKFYIMMNWLFTRTESPYLSDALDKPVVSFRRNAVSQVTELNLVSLEPRTVSFIQPARVQFLRDQQLRRGGQWRFSALRRRHHPPGGTPDPYIAALLIVLAQRHRNRRRELRNTEGSGQDMPPQDETPPRGQNQQHSQPEKTPVPPETLQDSLQDKETAATPGNLPESRQEGKGSHSRNEEDMAEQAEEVGIFPVGVIVCHSDELRVFTAEIPQTFLLKLDNPFELVAVGSSIDIRCQRVSYWPISTLARRVGAALWRGVPNPEAPLTPASNSSGKRSSEGISGGEESEDQNGHTKRSKWEGTD